ncbi:MAG: hypothetical protein AAGI28_00535 [Pseudomonadota bacterium]
MINWSLVLIDGTVLSLLIVPIVIFSFLRRPRIWLGDFPDDIAASTDPITPEEKSLAAKVGLSVVAVMLVVLALSSARFGFESGFFWAALHTFLVFQFFNIVDISMDWVMLWRIDPADPPIPGTANAPGWTNYSFHFWASVKGSVIGLPFAAIAAGLGWLAVTYL